MSSSRFDKTFIGDYIKTISTEELEQLFWTIDVELRERDGEYKKFLEDKFDGIDFDGEAG